MSNLSSDELSDITKIVNDRMAEFGTGVLGALRPGIVRLVHDVIVAWQEEADVPQPWPAVNPVADEAAWIMDGYHVGYQEGKVAAMRAMSSRRDDAEDHDAPGGHPLSLLNGRVADVLQHVADLDIPDPTSYVNGNGHASVASLLGNDINLTMAPVERVTLPPAASPEPPTALQLQADLEAAVIAALREMAVDGTMPGQKAWDRDKPAHLPLNSAIRSKLGIGWNELARRAGLPPNTGRVANLHKRKATPAEAAQPEPEPDPVVVEVSEPAPAPEKPMRVIQLPRTLAEVDADEATARRHSRPAPAPRQHTRPPTVDEVVAEVKRQSMGGVMPTMAAFDLARPAVWPTAGSIMAHLEVSWTELAGLARLRPNRVADMVTA